MREGVVQDEPSPQRAIPQNGASLHTSLADEAVERLLGAGLLGLPGSVAGVVRDGKLSLVQAEGFADLESRTPMRQDHIFFLASLTKTFTAVMMMQYVQEKKISLDD